MTKLERIAKLEAELSALKVQVEKEDRAKSLEFTMKVSQEQDDRIRFNPFKSRDGNMTVFTTSEARGRNGFMSEQKKISGHPVAFLWRGAYVDEKGKPINGYIYRRPEAIEEDLHLC